MSGKKIELLAPARTADSGIIAIQSGADAVYIGAPRFSARAAVGNTIQDIERLTAYAHQYHARVYVALNTILYDHEMESARQMIHELAATGMDALIIQDMGILELDLPPLELHASTQTHNYSLEKIQFLEQVGFSRVVLARELTMEQIMQIRAVTTVELEAFVHGALCVSLSGQCYMSEAQGGRSGNRGVCAQPCRKLYDLIDSQGKVVQKHKHLLSLKDLDLSAHVGELILGGVSSLKIEGRLKDDNYLKNTTVHYRRELDRFFNQNPEFGQLSSGYSEAGFNPDMALTFTRGYSNYFLKGRHSNLTSFDTPKSAGEYVGTVKHVSGNVLEIVPGKELHNNDGLTWFDANGVLQGVKVNVVDGNRITLAKSVNINHGTSLFRNYHHQFSEMLENSRPLRKIPVTIKVSEEGEGLNFLVADEYGLSLKKFIHLDYVEARKSQKAENTFLDQLAKSGDTIYEIRKIDLDWQRPWFLPISVINSIRRTLLDEFTFVRIANHPKGKIFKHNRQARWLSKHIDYTGNVSNQHATSFYFSHGAESIDPALEVSKDYKGKRLMSMKHCLKYQLGYCPRESDSSLPSWQEPLYLKDGNTKFRVEFDCKACLMNLYHL